MNDHELSSPRKRGPITTSSGIWVPAYGVPATHSAPLRAFTPVFDGLWTRVDALLLSRGAPRGDDGRQSFLAHDSCGHASLCPPYGRFACGRNSAQIFALCAPSAGTAP